MRANLGGKCHAIAQKVRALCAQLPNVISHNALCFSLPASGLAHVPYSHVVRYELVHSNQPMGHMGGECSELKEQWERMYANHLMLHVQSLKELKEALITSWIQEAGLAV